MHTDFWYAQVGCWQRGENISHYWSQVTHLERDKCLLDNIIFSDYDALKTTELNDT